MKQFVTAPMLGTSLLAMSLLAAGLAPAVAQADDWPTRPVELVVLTGPGGASDIFARNLARAVEPALGQPVIVVNRPGGGGATQMAALRSAAPDGYTLGVNTLSHFTSMQSNLKGVFAVEDFDWITMVQQDSFLLFVNADSPIQTMEDVTRLAQERGGSIDIGGFGPIGSPQNIATRIIMEAAGAEENWVSFSATSDTVAAVLGDHVEVGSGNPGPLIDFVESGRVRVLGVLADQRSAALPDVPTFAEQGLEADTEWQQIRGIFGPAGIPDEVQATIAAAFETAIADEEFKAFEAVSGADSRFMGPEDYTAYIGMLDEMAVKGLQAVAPGE